MDFQELAKVRYAAKKFTDEPIPQEKLDLILEAGRIAPTAANKQPQRIIVVTGDKLEIIRECTANIYGATVAAVVCYDRDEAVKIPVNSVDFGLVDATIVFTTMMYQAADLDVGTCWIGYFKEEPLREKLQLPENVVPTGILIMGIPAEDCAPLPNHTNRKALEETTCFLS